MGGTGQLCVTAFLCVFISTVAALDCPHCIHIVHRSYHGLIRSQLDRFNMPTCGFNNVSVGHQLHDAHLVKCDRPGDRHEYKCGLIRGRASVKVDGQQQQDQNIPIDLAVRMCIQVPEDREDEYCEEDLGVQAEYLRQALSSKRYPIPIQQSNVRAYQGETCFCSDEQCISGASPLVFTLSVVTSLGLIWSLNNLLQ